jgi:hypothetical protein
VAGKESVRIEVFGSSEFTGMLSFSPLLWFLALEVGKAQNVVEVSRRAPTMWEGESQNIGPHEIVSQ